MIERLKEGWRAGWFEPAAPANLRACRVVLGAQALYILLSRPDIPRLVSWPETFFPAAARLETLRYGIGLGHEGLEWALWAVLHAALLLVVAGKATRVSCAAAGLLLYHFAPFEEIIVGMPHTHFGGLTTSAVGLLVLAFASQPPSGDAAPSAEYRWPLTLVRLVFSFTYFSAFLAKLRYSGILWFTGGTLRGYLLSAQAITQPVLALPLASRMSVCWAMAAGAFFLESLFPLAAFSTRARRVLVPAAALFHLGNVLALGINFPSAPLLLLFVNWEWLAGRLRPRRREAARPPREAAAGPS